jgi:hypothetical protein
MNLTEARTKLAAAVSTVVLDESAEPPALVKCTPRPVQNNNRVGDAWVVFRRTVPGPSVGDRDVVLEAIVSLGPDQTLADALVDDLAERLLASVDTQPELYGRDISVEPQRMIAVGSGNGTIYALTLSITLELSA